MNSRPRVLRGRALSRLDGCHQLPRRFIAVLSVSAPETCRATRATVAAVEGQFCGFAVRKKSDRLPITMRHGHYASSEHKYVVRPKSRARPDQ